MCLKSVYFFWKSLIIYTYYCSHKEYDIPANECSHSTHRIVKGKLNLQNLTRHQLTLKCHPCWSNPLFSCRVCSISILRYICPRSENIINYTVVFASVHYGCWTLNTGFSSTRGWVKWAFFERILIKSVVICSTWNHENQYSKVNSESDIHKCSSQSMILFHKFIN